MKLTTAKMSALCLGVGTLLMSCANMTNMEKSLTTLADEAENGDMNSAHALCYRYSNGMSAPQDDEQAFKWCTLAAATQNPKSMTLLADLYYEGRGVEQDYNKAAKLYYYAAERGIEKAMFMLYHHFHNGYGVARDETEANYYLNRAADRKYMPAIKLKQELLLQ